MHVHKATRSAFLLIGIARNAVYIRFPIHEINTHLAYLKSLLASCFVSYEITDIYFTRGY